MIKDRQAEFSMSFNMLFSVILIAIFVALAIYVISYFFKMQCSISLGLFSDNIQSDVDFLWKNDITAEKNENYRIGMFGRNCAEKVCFFNTQNTKFKGFFLEEYNDIIDIFIANNNLYFYPTNKSNKISFEIKNLDTSDLTNNPECFNIENGKVIIPLKKSSNEALVKLGKF